jgi:uncharacterized membrane protein YqjE
MIPTVMQTAQLRGVSKRFSQRLLAIGENRLQLLMIEVQEERQHLLQVFFLSLAAAGMAVIACILFTIAVVVMFWSTSPVTVLLVLSCVYSAAAFLLSRRLGMLQRNWKFLPETLDQFQKDRSCLEKILA